MNYPYFKLTDSIGGLTQILPAEGRVVSPGEIDQERQGRVSSGKLVSDVLTSKRKYSIRYSLLDTAVVSKLVELRQSNNDLTLQYQEVYAGTIASYTVRIVAPITRTRMLATSTGLCSDVEIEIEEV
jgi:hypothetical protein